MDGDRRRAMFYVDVNKAWLLEVKKGRKKSLERSGEYFFVGLIDFVVTGVGRTMNQVVLKCHPWTRTVSRVCCLLFVLYRDFFLGFLLYLWPSISSSSLLLSLLLLCKLCNGILRIWICIRIYVLFYKNIIFKHIKNCYSEEE